MSTALSLHHLGEVVLRSLLEKLARTNELGAIPCKLHESCSLLSVLLTANVRVPCVFADNVRLAPVSLGGKAVQFDGARGVDVLCHDGSRGLPIEAKLGLDGLSPTAFTERFLGPLKLSTHKTPRFTGSMTAILNYRGIGDGGPLSLRTEDPSVDLAPPWFLVIRAQAWKSWASEGPDFSNAHVALFEDIAKAYGDATAFDQLVLEQVGTGFHSAWKVFS